MTIELYQGSLRKRPFSRLFLLTAVWHAVTAFCLPAADREPILAPPTRTELSPHPFLATGNSPDIGPPAAVIRPWRLSTSQGTSSLQIYSHGDPTPQEQYMLELVNRARMNPTAEAARFGIDLNEGVDPTNTISTLPKQPLAFNPSLIQSARGHSQWMLDNDIFSHYGSGGSNPFDRMQAAGFVLAGNASAGENIGWEGTTGTLNLNQTVAGTHRDLFVDEGIDGRGHRINLMEPDFCEVGLGIKQGVFTVNNVNYNAGMTTQDFGKTDADPASFLVGVVYQDKDGDGFYAPGEGLAGVTVTPASGSSYAVTSTSGGYAIPLSSRSGTFSVTIFGGSVTAPITKSVTLTGANVKLDFDTTKDKPAPSKITLSAPRFMANGSFTFSLTGDNNSAPVTVQGSPDLIHWTDLGTNATVNFTDLPASTVPRRFYRAWTK